MSIFDPFRINKQNKQISKTGQVLRVKPYDQAYAITPREIEKAKELLKGVGQWPPDPTPPVPVQDNTFVVTESIGLCAEVPQGTYRTEYIDFRDIIAALAGDIHNSLEMEQFDVFSYNPEDILDIAWRFKIHTYICEIWNQTDYNNISVGFKFEDNDEFFSSNLKKETRNNLIVLTNTNVNTGFLMFESLEGEDNVKTTLVPYSPDQPDGAGCLTDIYFSGPDALELYQYISLAGQIDNPVESHRIFTIRTTEPTVRHCHISFSAHFTVKVKDED